MASRVDELVAAAEVTASGLDKMRSAPYLFIEYAVGLDLHRFAELIDRLHSIERISACIDIGHVGIWQTRAAFGCQHPERDVCALGARDPDLPDLVADVQRSVETALPAVLQLTRSVGRIGKPLHFHMHDGHPLKAGIADHLSFLGVMPIPFEFRGRQSLANMFGVAGLAQIVSEVLAVCGCDRATFTLEIHPTQGRLALDDAASLFAHWRDTTNAERMNHWLSMLVENQQVLLTCLEAGLQA